MWVELLRVANFHVGLVVSSKKTEQEKNESEKFLNVGLLAGLSSIKLLTKNIISNPIHERENILTRCEEVTQCVAQLCIRSSKKIFSRISPWNWTRVALRKILESHCHHQCQVSRVGGEKLFFLDIVFTLVRKFVWQIIKLIFLFSSSWTFSYQRKTFKKNKNSRISSEWRLQQSEGAKNQKIVRSP